MNLRKSKYISELAEKRLYLKKKILMSRSNKNEVYRLYLEIDLTQPNRNNTIYPSN